jgi:hypothetical protein
LCKDVKIGTQKQNSHDRTSRRGQPGQDSRDRTARTRQLGQQERAVQIIVSGPDRRARLGTGQPKENREGQLRQIFGTEQP